MKLHIPDVILFIERLHECLVRKLLIGQGFAARRPTGFSRFSIAGVGFSPDASLVQHGVNRPRVLAELWHPVPWL